MRGWKVIVDQIARASTHPALAGSKRACIAANGPPGHCSREQKKVTLAIHRGERNNVALIGIPPGKPAGHPLILLGNRGRISRQGNSSRRLLDPGPALPDLFGRKDLERGGTWLGGNAPRARFFGGADPNIRAQALARVRSHAVLWHWSYLAGDQDPLKPTCGTYNQARSVFFARILTCLIGDFGPCSAFQQSVK